VTGKCHQCGAVLHATHRDYRYIECGLQNVVLKNLLVHVCDECGEEVPEIPNIGNLHRAIARDILTKRTLLCGEEVKFLRKMARMTASTLASLIGVTSTHVSKWENNKLPMGASSERLLRLICYAGVLERFSKIDAGLKVEMAKTAAVLPSLDIFELLKQIENRSGGPKKVTIDASDLTHCGEQVSNTPDAMAVN